MRVISNLTDSFMNLVRRIGNFSIGGIIEGGKSRAMKIENAQFQIKGLLGRTAEAKKELDAIMDDVNYGVQDTAYGLDAAASVASQLVASGLKAGDQMKATLRGISGVAAMTNSSYEDIGNIYTRIAGQGRVMAIDLNSLAARGLNAAAIIGQALGKTEAEVRDMTSKGKIDFMTFSKAMDDAFGKHAKEANKTFNGVISNIKAALAKVGADFYGPLIKEESPIILFLNSIRERINELRKSVAPITNEVTTKLNNFITSLDNLFKKSDFLGFKPFEESKDTFKSINKLLENTTGNFNNLSKEELLNKGFTEDQIKTFDKLRDTSKQTGLSIKDILTVSSDEKASFNTRYLMLNTIKNIGMSLTEILKPVVKAFGEVFNVDTSGLYDVVSIFHRFSEIMKNGIINNAENIQRIAKSIFSVLKAIISVVSIPFKAILRLIDALNNSLEETQINIFDIFGNGADKITEWSTNFLDNLQIDKIKEALTNLKNFLSNIDKEKLLSGGIIVSIGLLIKKMVDLKIAAVRLFSKGMFGDYNPFNLTKTFSTVIGSIKTFIADMGKAFKNLYTSIGTSVKFNAVANIIKSISLAIAVIAASLVALSMVDQEKLKTAGAVMVAIIASLSLVILSMKFLENIAIQPKTIVSLLLLVAVIAVLSLIVNKIKDIDIPLTKILSLVVLMTALTLLLYPLVTLGTALMGPQILGAIIGIAALTAMVIPLKKFIEVLRSMENISNATENVKTIVILITSLTVCMTALGILSPLIAMGIYTLYSLVDFVTAVGIFATAIGVIMKAKPELKDFLNNGMSLFEEIANGIGRILGNVISGFTDTVANGLPNLGKNLSEFANNLEPFITIMSGIDPSITDGIDAIINSFLKIVGANFLDELESLITNPFKGYSSLELFMGKLVSFANGFVIFVSRMGEISDSSIEKANARIETFKKIVEAANDIPNQDGLVNLFTGDNKLSTFASQLKPLGTGLQSFISAISSGINDDSNISNNIETIKSIVDIFKTLAEASANIPNMGGVAAFFAGDNKIGDFANEFADTSTGIKTLIDSFKDVSIEESTKNNITFGLEIFKTLAEASKGLDNQLGFVAGIVGDNGIGQFAGQFSTVGICLKELIQQFIDLPIDDTLKGKINFGMDIFKTLADASQDLPNQLGFIAGIVGDNGIGQFAGQFSTVGIGLKELIQQFIDLPIDETLKDKVRFGMDIFKTLAEASQSLPNQLGFIAGIVGDNGIGQFAGQFSTVGICLKELIEQFIDLPLDEDLKNKVKFGMEIFQTLAEASKGLENQMGLIGIIVGDNGIGQFAGQFKKVGQGIHNLISELTKDIDINENSVKVVETAGNILTALASIGETGASQTKSSITSLAENLDGLSEKLIDFVNKFKDLTSSDVETAGKNISELIKVINSLMEIDTEKLSTLSDSLKKAGEEAIKAFVDSVNDNKPKEDAANAVKNIIDAMKTAADEQKSNVKDKFNEVGEQAYQGVNWDGDRGQWRYFSFESLGKNFVEGFANGIRNNMSLSNNAASELGKHALEKAKESIDSNSPSKETYKLGTYFGQGFYGGIMAYRSTVGNAAEDIGTYARDSLRSAVAQAELIASSDMDMSPTIRPVLDLSDIQSGSRSIGSLLSNQTIGLNANLSSISRSMNSRLQNGANSDVVSAIDSLSKNLGSTRGDTYNINGVNYTSDSEVSAAIKTLVGAVVNKRRI